MTYLAPGTRRGSNPRPRPCQGRALPTELRAHLGRGSGAERKRSVRPEPSSVYRTHVRRRPVLSADGQPGLSIARCPAGLSGALSNRFPTDESSELLAVDRLRFSVDSALSFTRDQSDKAKEAFVCQRPAKERKVAATVLREPPTCACDAPDWFELDSHELSLTEPAFTALDMHPARRTVKSVPELGAELGPPHRLLHPTLHGTRITGTVLDAQARLFEATEDALPTLNRWSASEIEIGPIGPYDQLLKNN